jgi:Lysyl oxidase
VNGRHRLRTVRAGLRGLLGALVGTLGIAGATALANPPVAQPGDLLPDLVQEPPSDIGITQVRGRYLLGFRSAVHNAGEGPLTIVGRRANRSVRDMTAVQVIRRSDGTSRTVHGTGFLRYVTSPDHSHWHFLPFERYELRRVGSDLPVVRDRKTGFCLGDRYRAEPRPAGSVAAPVYVTRCGFGNTARLGLREGISVGWGDDYAAYLDGQHIDVTDLPAGRYLLVHIVNPSGRILERDRSNNSATRTIVLRTVRGRVTVQVVPLSL